jgi:serine-type D-Ala-D-Ala carboxypeptidase
VKSDEISAFLTERIEAGDFPSAVYLVAERGNIVFSDALGFAVKTNEVQIPARLETIYDLASLTKPLVTGLLCAKLIEAEKLEFGRTIDFYLPEFARIAASASEVRPKVSLAALLTHASAFQAWKPFYLLAENRTDVLREIVKTPRNFAQASVTYSDLNFLTLTFLLERIYARRIDDAAAEEIFKSLNLQNTFFNPPAELRNKIAASEFGNRYEEEMCREMGYKTQDLPGAFRNGLIWGAVHDGNCRFMDGVSGHAGLFSTAAEVFQLAQQFLPGTTAILKPETCDLFKTNRTPGLNEARSVAFQLAATADSTASEALSPDSFGHLGFTGTSLWIEPETERVFILLTNRTHRALPFVNINSTRRRFHQIAARLLNEK